MSIEKIERLEELVALALEVLDNLHAEKTSLEQRVRGLEKDQSAIHLKVQNALQKIEKMDFF